MIFQSKSTWVQCVIARGLKLQNLVLLYVFLLAFSAATVRLGSISETGEQLYEECVSVIVTGSYAEGGRAILMKNRDTGDTMNRPIYYPSEGSGTYAYVMVNWVWMGINERGLAVMNTAVGALGFGGSGMDNGALNGWIVKHCETVEEVCFELNNTESPIGPGNRLGGTCVGVVDRFGNGAFIEVSGVESYARFVVDGYDSQANHPRYYPGYASGPSGRDQYALDIMDEVYTQKGFISWEDVAQNVSRYVRNKEQGNSCFSISGEMCRTSTQAVMVAVSGDSRYDGKLNVMWGEYGNPPMVGLFVPSMAHTGNPPTILNDFWNEVWAKRSYAHGSCGSYYDPVRVREIQGYTFFAEDYTFARYGELMDTIPDGLSDEELEACLRSYVEDSVRVATMIYGEEAEVLHHATGTGFYITTVSNSSVSDFEFSTVSGMSMSFDVVGPSDTMGFCYVAVPVALWSGGFNVIVGDAEYVVGDPFQCGSESLLNFTYVHSDNVSISTLSYGETYVYELETKLLNASANEVYFLYADPAYMTRPESAYDITSGGIIYGLCENPQNQGFNTTTWWLLDTGAINATTISNATIAMFGGPYPHVAVRYYEDSHVGSQDGNWLAPVRFAENASHYWFENQTYAVVGMLSLSAVVNGHEDFFVIETFAEEDNFFLVMYGFDWKGTWAAGIYFKEVMLVNLSDYEGQYYVFHWVDDFGQDGVPQSSEICMATFG